jgi:hypothetical protein
MSRPSHAYRHPLVTSFPCKPYHTGPALKQPEPISAALPSLLMHTYCREPLFVDLVCEATHGLQPREGSPRFWGLIKRTRSGQRQYTS